MTMDSAWIAVIGTLGGVVVTSASAIVVGWLTVRGQRRNTALQRVHDVSEHRREERRETFVEYLAAYSELREKVLGMHEQAQPTTTPLTELYPTEVARFSRAYQALRIFCSPPTGEAAHGCSSHLWDLADAVRRGDTEAIAQDRDEGRRLRRELRTAMQHELGVALDDRT
jgi:hypothetical protein